MSGVTLIGFVTARLDEDERLARAATSGPWSACDAGHEDSCCGEVEDSDGWLLSAGIADAAHIATHDPARVLRGVEAKRELLALHEACGHPNGLLDRVMFPSMQHVLGGAIKTLAAEWSDHPDFEAAVR